MDMYVISSKKNISETKIFLGLRQLNVNEDDFSMFSYEGLLISRVFFYRNVILISYETAEFLEPLNM